MANSQSESMILSSSIMDETTNMSKKQAKTIYGHSSSSSIDSSNGNNVNLNGNKSSSSSKNLLTTTTSSKNLLTATASSTTTDSDLESEQDDSLQLQQHKSDSSTSDQLSRRAKHFHKLFKSEIPNDTPDPIASYVCAYQGDILLQGRMYITNRYLCFHSRIINYVTKHVYRWEHIEHISKERVAYIFPTAIGIQVKPSGKKITYASFLLRDQAYEKLHSIWSRYRNDHQSYDDDNNNNNDIENDGTLKATNMNEKNRYSYRDTYDNINGSEQEVLQLCLKKNQRKISSSPRKSNDEKQSLKKLEKKSSKNKSHQDEKLSNEIDNTNQTIRNSRYTKNEQKSNDKTTRNSSLANQRSQSRNRDTTVSQTDEIISHSNPVPISNSNSNGILNKIISYLNHINQYFSSLFPTYPMKTTIIIFLILTILFLHSFYLIKLAYRIEYRLQSLHHLWPSSSSSMKNSFSSNIKDL